MKRTKTVPAKNGLVLGETWDGAVLLAVVADMVLAVIVALQVRPIMNMDQRVIQDIMVHHLLLEDTNTVPNIVADILVLPVLVHHQDFPSTLMAMTQALHHLTSTAVHHLHSQRMTCQPIHLLALQHHPHQQRASQTTNQANTTAILTTTTAEVVQGAVHVEEEADHSAAAVSAIHPTATDPTPTTPSIWAISTSAL